VGRSGDCLLPNFGEDGVLRERSSEQIDHSISELTATSFVVAPQSGERRCATEHFVRGLEGEKNIIWIHAGWKNGFEKSGKGKLLQHTGDGVRCVEKKGNGGLRQLLSERRELPNGLGRGLVSNHRDRFGAAGFQRLGKLKRRRCFDASQGVWEGPLR